MTRARRRVQYCAFPPIHVRPKDDDDEYDDDLLFRLYRWRVSANDVALRVCVRRLIHGRRTSLSVREERRLLRVCECARRLDGRLLGPSRRRGSAGVGGKTTTTRRRDRRCSSAEVEKGQGGQRDGRWWGGMITGYHRGDHSAILRFKRNEVRWILVAS